MEEVENLLKNRTIDFQKLIEYGFTEKEDIYKHKTTLIKDEFDIIITFDKNEKLETKVIDKNSNDEYVLFKIQSAEGDYVGKVREAYTTKLVEIINKCSKKEIFKSIQAKQVIQYIKQKYDDDIEFPWGEKDGNAIFRHKDNKKWYATLFTISKEKLGLPSNEITNISNLKIPPETIEKIVDNEKYFPAYHMNKKHWMSVILDGSIEIEEIFKYIDMSHDLK